MPLDSARLARSRFLVFGALWLTAACGSSALEPDDTDIMEDVPDELQSPRVPMSTGPLNFKAACAPGATMVLTGLGDVLLHTRLQNQAKSRDGAPENDNFDSLWHGAKDVVSAADITYANFEGPADGNRKGASYPAFNYAPTLIPALQALGVDVVSTANNHALDQGFGGLKSTLDAMERYGMPHSGTSRGGEVESHEWNAETNTTKDSTKFSIAWIACSFAQNSASGATNGIKDSNNAVLNCERDQDVVLKRISELASTHDAVVVTPHWGVEYELSPRLAQTQMARAFVNAGARLVLGNHPHVPQTWERLKSNRDGRDAFVIYSMGNFISGQLPGVVKSPYTWRTLAAHVGLVRTADGLTEISGVRFTPLYARPRAGVVGVVPALSEAANDPLAQQVIDTADTMYGKEHRVAVVPAAIRGTWSGSGFSCQE